MDRPNKISASLAGMPAKNRQSLRAFSTRFGQEPTKRLCYDCASVSNVTLLPQAQCLCYAVHSQHASYRSARHSSSLRSDVCEDLADALSRPKGADGGCLPMLCGGSGSLCTACCRNCGRCAGIFQCLLRFAVCHDAVRHGRLCRPVSCSVCADADRQLARNGGILQRRAAD